MTDQQQRYSRQRDIVPVGRLAGIRATVIGVGAIGRQVALQLAALGISHLELVDFDIVELSNLASQGYLQEDLGKAKVVATAALCRQLNHNLEIRVVNDRFRRGMKLGNTLFCCVDKIAIRKLIWQASHDRVGFFCDGRMNAEVIRILTACDEKSRQYYPQTLFAPADAYTGACTARTTIYTANIAAGLLLSQFTRFLRNLPVDYDLQLNLLSTELYTPCMSFPAG